MSDYHVIVIGAGCGGLSVGAQLAQQGRKVLVLEQTERIGGCCSTFEREGFKFDLGASIVEAVDLMDRVFQRLGTSIWKEVDLIPCDPIYTVICQDGTRMTIPKSLSETAERIRSIAPQDEAGWNAFCEYMQGFTGTLNDFFVTPTLTGADMLKIFARSPKLLKYLPLFVNSYQDVIRKYFTDPHVQEALAYQTFFIGLPPELAPGLFAVIPYQEHDGVYYSRGGMIGIPAALQRCGERFGMEVRLNTAVAKVLVQKGRAVGVQLEDGTRITADCVVSDINAKTLYLDLIGAEHLPWLARVGVQSYEYAMAVPMLYLGVDYIPPLESHHTLVTVPMEEMNAFWWHDYKGGGFTAKQFGIISWTTASDPQLAPAGKHVLILTLPPAPRLFMGKTWDSVKKDLIQRYIAYYDEKYIPGLAKHVQVADLATPTDFERNLRTPAGAIYALRQDITHETAFRPAAKSKSIQGLYLVGASTHPGGGVPTTIASGIVAADLIAQYEQ